MNLTEFRESIPERAREYAKLDNAADHDGRYDFLQSLMTEMDELDLPDVEYWEVMTKFLGNNYMDELEYLGLLEESEADDIEWDEDEREDEDEDKRERTRDE